MSLFKKLAPYIRGYARESVLGPLFKLLETGFELLVPLVVARMIDEGIAQRSEGTLFALGGLLLLLGAAGLAFSITAQYFAARASVGFAQRLRGTLFARVASLSPAQLDAQGASGLVQRLTGDVDQVQSGLNLALRLMLRSPFVVFGAMAMAFLVDAGSAWVFAVAIPILALLVFGVMALSVPLFSRAQALMDSVTRIARESLTGARVIRAFGREADENARFLAEVNALTARRRKAARVSALTNPLTCAVINLALAALLYTGALRVQSGAISQGELVALVNYMSQILVELIKLASLILSVSKAIACFARVESVIELPEGLPTRKARAALEDALGAAVRFEDVSLTYPGAGAPSLSHISFTALRGETIGIVGPTGAGKSSLINLIPRFYDATSGEVRVYGEDVRMAPLEALRARVGIVPQKTVLFSGSILDNVRFGRPDAAEADVNEALARAQGADIAQKKADGLRANVGQAGRALSGGQKQRVAIARAMVRNPDILILDDSASALDFATDARLRAAIRAHMGECTVFITAQRASSVRHADKILVLDEGRMVAMGAHEDLMRDCALYREIYFSQFPEGEAHA